MQPHPPQRILLVDDDESLASMLAEILQLHGFGVEAATSGEAALARLEAEIALRDLLPRITGVSILPNQDAALLRPGGPKSLRVAFDAA